MNLVFPTHLPFPLYPTPPALEDEAGPSAFFEALREFFEHLRQQHTTTQRYFAAANLHFDNSNQESWERTSSADITEEAIASVIKNITYPSKGEYVWDSAQNRWVLKLIPI